ncbi:MAG: 5' nucleotidase, NT5C type [Nanoarchaeota archaeon]
MNAENIILGVDIDNTLLKQVHHFLSYIKEHIDPSFTYERWNKWDVLDHFPEHHEKLIGFLKSYFSPENRPNMVIMDHAAEFLSHFNKENIYYITARSTFLFKDPVGETEELLELLGAPLADDHLLLQRNPASGVKKCKSIIAKENHVDLFLEDNPENAKKIATYCPVLLIDYPFNRHMKESNIIRIGAFDDTTGEWKKNPWKDALEMLDSGKLQRIIGSARLG